MPNGRTPTVFRPIAEQLVKAGVPRSPREWPGADWAKLRRYFDDWGLTEDSLSQLREAVETASDGRLTIQTADRIDFRQKPRTLAAYLMLVDRKTQSGQRFVLAPTLWVMRPDGAPVDMPE